MSESEQRDNPRLEDVLAWAGLHGDCSNAVINIVTAAYNRAHPTAPYVSPPVRLVSVDNRVHGKRGTYVQGCRCEECSTANALYFREYKARVSSSLDSAQRAGSDHEAMAVG